MNKKVSLGTINSTITSVCKIAVELQQTQQQVIDNLQGLTKELYTKTPAGKARYTKYILGYYRGIRDVMHHNHYQHLEFCFLIDGTLFSTSKQTNKRSLEEFYATGKGYDLRSYPCNF